MTRKLLPDTRQGVTEKIEISGLDLYVTITTYPDGSIGEVMATVAKDGSNIREMADLLTAIISLALQHGCPWAAIRDQLTARSFDPRNDSYRSIPFAIAAAVQRFIDSKPEAA